MRARLADGALGVLLVLGMAVSGCSALDTATTKVTNVLTGGGGSKPAQGTPGFVSGFLGGVVVDEPRAALAARQVLSSGGTAADAAVAAAFMLSVSLPSRAGLGGGGACMAYDPDKNSANGGVPEALLFVPPPGGGNGERPAAVPTMARAMFALHARYGRAPFESLIIGAEQSARFGMPISRAFARDLALVAGPLSGDPAARAIFFQPDGQPFGEGVGLVQTDLGVTLAQLRVAGVGDLYNGALANKLVDAAGRAGGGLTAEALRDVRPGFAPAIIVAGPGHDSVAFLPPPADGGLAAAAAFRSLMAAPGDLQAAQDRALAVAAAWRAQGGQGDPAALLAGAVPPASLPALPASAGLVTLDRDGRVVACSFTMNNLFGTGRIAPGTGILLAASPSWMPPALLAAGVGWNPNIHTFHAAVAASGQEGAPLAAADVLMQSLRAPHPIVFDPQPFASESAIQLRPGAVAVSIPVVLRPAPEPGRADVIGCSGFLPGDNGSCSWSADPRNAGLAVGSN
jgi:gamma-glutamyltranspeptidase/glutathione hydrolase